MVVSGTETRTSWGKREGAWWCRPGGEGVGYATSVAPCLGRSGVLGPGASRTASRAAAMRWPSAYSNTNGAVLGSSSSSRGGPVADARRCLGSGMCARGRPGSSTARRRSRMHRCIESDRKPNQTRTQPPKTARVRMRVRHHQTALSLALPPSPSLSLPLSALRGWCRAATQARGRSARRRLARVDPHLTYYIDRGYSGGPGGWVSSRPQSP